MTRPTQGDRIATDREVCGQLVYAIGDIHGRYDLLRDMLAELRRDYAGRARGRRPVLVFCGDYVDRGPDSAKVLEALVWLRRRPELTMRLLKGNHEQAMLEFIETPDKAGIWIEFGGSDTVASYGVLPPRPGGGPAEYIRARDELIERMPASHLRLLGGLELGATIGDYAFVHAGVRPGRPLAKQTEADLLWIRKGFLDVEGPFEKVIVHGHTWTDDQPRLSRHRLSLDTGSYATGVLTAVRLEDGEVAVLQVRRPPLAG